MSSYHRLKDAAEAIEVFENRNSDKDMYFYIEVVKEGVTVGAVAGSMPGIAKEITVDFEDIENNWTNPLLEAMTQIEAGLNGSTI